MAVVGSLQDGLRQSFALREHPDMLWHGQDWFWLLESRQPTVVMQSFPLGWYRLKVGTLTG